MSSSNWCLLTCIPFSQEAGKLVFLSLEEFSIICCDLHNQRFDVVNKAEVDVFLELSCFFNDPTDVGSLISGSSAFSETSLNIWKFMLYVPLKPTLEDFEHYFTSVWDECNCAIVSILWHSLSLALEWKLPFSGPVATAEFSKFAGILSAALSRHHLLGFEIVQLEFHHLRDRDGRGDLDNDSQKVQTSSCEINKN